jgi:hypothetical protein
MPAEGRGDRGTRNKQGMVKDMPDSPAAALAALEKESVKADKVRAQLQARHEALEVVERELRTLKEGIDMAALEVRIRHIRTCLTLKAARPISNRCTQEHSCQAYSCVRSRSTTAICTTLCGNDCFQMLSFASQLLHCFPLPCMNRRMPG